jgi:acetyl-CoA acyltransferase
MKPHRRVFIVDGYITDFIGKFHPDFIWKGHEEFGQRENPTIEEHLTEAIRGALDASGVSGDAIQKGYVGNFAGGLFVNQLHMGSLAARADEGLDGIPFARVEGACASGGLAIVGAIESIQAGYDVTLASGAEVQTTYNARDGAEILARASHYETERDLDTFAFPAMFARRARVYKERFGLDGEELRHVVLKAYENANRNPRAHMHSVEVDEETARTENKRNAKFLSNEELRDHLKVLECSPVSDGAAAVVLASEEGLRQLGKSPEDCVEVTSYAQRTGALGRTTEYTRLDQVQKTVEEALSDSDLAIGDVGVAEVHDCFAIAEVLMMEAIGLAEHGEGINPIREGRTRIDGDLPVNTGGGLLGFGHPIGATGIKQLLEVKRQIRGECGDYQIAKPPRIGLTANMGGDDRTCVSFLVRG